MDIQGEPDGGDGERAGRMRHIKHNEPKTARVRDHLADYTRATLELEDTLGSIQKFGDSDEHGFIIYTLDGSYRITVEDYYGD